MNEASDIMYYAIFAVGIFWTFMSAIQLFVGIKRGIKIRSEDGATKVVGIVGGLLLTTISSVLMIM